MTTIWIKYCMHDYNFRVIIDNKNLSTLNVEFVLFCKVNQDIAG